MHKIIRFVIVGIVSIVLLNSLFFVAIAVYKTVHAYVLVAQGKVEERPGIHIAESLDGFMLALFFLIFSLGVSKLFLHESKFLSNYSLPWLKVNNFSDLKFIMWEVLLTTVLVYFTTKLIIVGNELNWNLLIFPSSILMLAVAYKLLKQGH